MVKEKSKKKESNAGKIRLAAMSIDEFNLVNPKIIIKENKVDLRLGQVTGKFALNFEMACHIERNLFQVGIGAEIFIEHDKTDIPVGTFKSAIDFEITGMEEYHKKEGKKTTVELPEEIQGACVAIAYSTARGMLYTKTLSTYLINTYFPILDGNQLMEGIRESNKQVRGK